MNRLLPVALASIVLAAGAAVASLRSDAVAEEKTYRIDPVHSTALFRVHHLGAGQFWGRFNQLEGTFAYADGGDAPQLDVTIQVESVDTNSEQLDRHLKSPDFFNAREWPTMRFVGRKATSVGDGIWNVVGDLTIRDVTREVTARLERTGVSETRMGSRCGFEATFAVKRSDHGMTYGVEQKMLGDEVRVIVGIEAAVDSES